jgi:hypothetical protein
MKKKNVKEKDPTFDDDRGMETMTKLLNDM